MSHRPDKQYSDHHRLDALFAKEINLWLSSMHINFDLFEICVLVTWHVTNLCSKLFYGVLWSCVTEVMLHQINVLASFPFQCLLYNLLVSRHIITQQTPDFSSYMRNAYSKSYDSAKTYFEESLTMRITSAYLEQWFTGLFKFPNFLFSSTIATCLFRVKWPFSWWLQNEHAWFRFAAMKVASNSCLWLFSSLLAHSFSFHSQIHFC